MDVKQCLVGLSFYSRVQCFHSYLRVRFTLSTSRDEILRATLIIDFHPFIL